MDKIQLWELGVDEKVGASEDVHVKRLLEVVSREMISVIKKKIETSRRSVAIEVFFRRWISNETDP